MKQLNLILLLSIIPVLVACPKLDYKHEFKFENKSDIDVYIYLGISDSTMGGSLYPDTTVARVKYGVPFEKGFSRYYTYNYEYDKEKTDTLCLFIFDADTFETCSWEEIRNGYKIIQRYDIGLQDLKKLNYIIIYPPTEAMKNMKMYPPYSQ